MESGACMWTSSTAMSTPRLQQVLMVRPPTVINDIISLLEFTEDYRLIFTGSIAGLAYFSITKYSMRGDHSNLYNSRSKCGMGAAYLTTPHETMS